MTSAASDAKKTPVPELIVGFLCVAVGLISLCGGGIRLLRPEAGVAPENFNPAFQSGALQVIFYGSVSLWLLLSAVLVVCGALMVIASPAARVLGLVFSWASVATAIVVMILYAAKVVPILSEQSLDAADILRVALAAPITGCCPTLWAVFLLGFLYSRPSGPAAT